MLVYYGIPAGLVLFVALNAYLKDKTVPKNRPFDWCFIAITALLWPVTTPFIIRKKLSARLQGQQQKASQEEAKVIVMPSQPAPTFGITSRR